MIKNTQKVFIFLTFFLITKNAFGSQTENPMTLQELVPFIQGTQKLYEDLQVSYTSQAQTIHICAETVKLLQNQQQTNARTIEQLINTTENQKNNIEDLQQQLVALLRITQKQDTEIQQLRTWSTDHSNKLQQTLSLITLQTQQDQQPKININSPNRNNNHHNVVIQNTSAMGSVNMATNGSTISSGPSAKVVFFQLAMLAGVFYALYQIL